MRRNSSEIESEPMGYENGDGFAKHYFDALQSDPDVVLAHAQAAKLFKARRRPA